MNESQPLSPLLFIIMILVVYGISLLSLALIHMIRGGKIKLTGKTERAAIFKTDQAEFRIDGVHKRISWRKQNQQWEAVPFDLVKNIETLHHSENTIWWEILLGGFNIWDFSGRYRDVNNSYVISLNIIGGDKVTLTILKQYEQRDWFLTQIFHNLNLKLISMFGWYKNLDSQGEQKLEQLMELFSEYGLHLNRS